MLFFGILAGLGAAFSQAFSYLFSRHFVTASGRSARQLLALAHVLMAGLSLLLAPFVFLPPREGWGSIALPLLGTAGCYFCGQAAFFWTVKQIPASRIAPLLGLKIVFMAVFGTTFFHLQIEGNQWLAIGLAAAAAVCLAKLGEDLSSKALVGLCLTCTGYALSDLSIPYLISAFDPERGMRATIWSVVLDYILCGLVVLPLAWRWRHLSTWRTWRQAIPFALTWYLSMCCFFAAIAFVEVFLAVILQSFRGITTLALGRAVAGTRLMHIEQRFARGQLWRQLAAATLMLIAIVVYAWHK